MASTYTITELAGSGSLLKEDFPTGTTYTLTITNKSLTGSGYLFMETLTYPPSELPLYFSGSVWSGSYAVGAVYDNYTQGISIDSDGTTVIEWTPGMYVTGSDVYVKATGGFGLSIS